MNSNNLYTYFNQIFERNYHQLLGKLNSHSSDKQKVVILCTGSYSPPHYGHFEMMRLTASYLKSKNMNVVLGFFSPSSDKYVHQKLQKQAIPFLQRVELLEDLINQYITAKEETVDFNYNIKVDKFEGEYPDFLDYPYICDLFKKKLNQMNIKLVYCVGSDLMKYNIHNEFRKFTDILVVVERDQLAIPVELKEKNDLFFVRNSSVSQISSTSIRNQTKMNSQQLGTIEQQSQQKEKEMQEYNQLFDSKNNEKSNFVNQNISNQKHLNNKHQDGDGVSAVSSVPQTQMGPNIIRVRDDINEFMWTEDELKDQQKHQRDNIS